MNFKFDEDIGCSYVYMNGPAKNTLTTKKIYQDETMLINIDFDGDEVFGVEICRFQNKGVAKRGQG